MSARFRVASLFLAIALVAPMMAIAQDEYVVDLSRIDPSAILARAGDVLMRAPDAAIDDLFQATHAAAQKPGEAKILCTLFDPPADRSFESDRKSTSLNSSNSCASRMPAS